jgi:hypothetical protein
VGQKHNKTDDIRVRLSEDTRRDLELIAADRDEALSVIVREALRAYVAGNRAGHVAEDQAPYGVQPAKPAKRAGFTRRAGQPAPEALEAVDRAFAAAAAAPKPAAATPRD